MAGRDIINGQLHVGGWIYSPPSSEPETDGKTLIARISNTATAEFQELALDAESAPYERQRWASDQPPSEEIEWERISLDEFIEKLEGFRQAVAGTPLETWNTAYDQAVEKASLAHEQNISETDEEGGENEDPSPIIESHVVYNLFIEGTPLRIIKAPSGPESRLEKYIFHKRENGQIELEFQEGWWAGSHYDGGAMMREIPQEWLATTWHSFLDRFCEQYPAEAYSYTKAELVGMIQLQRFLGL